MLQHDKSPEYLPVWQCIGCGRIDAPQTCIGVCRDKKVFLIGKDAHERALDEIARLRGELAALREHLLRFARCTPKPGQGDAAFQALQQQLRELIGEPAQATTRKAASP